MGESAYVLKLTKDEVLMLQQVLSEESKYASCYKWELDIRNRLLDKTVALYPRHRLPRTELERRLRREYEKCIEKGFGEQVAEGMRRSEEHRLKFYYAIEGAEAC